jgi:hypothetical protein
LEDSKDCRSVGGHGNQHVRLRSAQIDCIETICPALAALSLRAAADVRFEILRFDISRLDFKPTRLQGHPTSRPHRQITEFRKLLCIENLPKRQRRSGFGVFRIWQKKRCHSIPQ